MRKITFWLSLVLIFIVPWEDMLSIAAVGSISRLTGLIVAGFWFLTILSEGRFRKPHIFHAFVLFFFLWNIASYMWSMDVDRTVRRITTYGQIYLLLLIVWELYRKPEDLNAGIQAYVLGSYVCIASSIYNYLTGTVAVAYEVRYSATGVNAVDLALLLLLGIPLAWHLFLHRDEKKNKILKIINIAYIPLAVFAIFLTASRASLFAIVPAIIFILWPKQLDVGRSLIILVFLAVSLLIIWSILPAGVIERLATTTTSIGSADIGGRVNLWKEAITVFLGHPLFGSGSGTLGTAIGTLSHQTFLSVLAETGLIGFFLFTCILVIVINHAANLLKGYSELWFTVFFTWFIGVLALSWEMKKVTWLLFSFVIIQGVALRERYHSEKLKSTTSETEKGQFITNTVGFKG
jgi:O-antigen ligase